MSRSNKGKYPAGNGDEAARTPDSVLELTMEYTPLQMAHVWMAIANFQAYRATDPDETVRVLGPGHPLVRLQSVITEKLPFLISEGIQHGWDVKDLITIQEQIVIATESALAEEDHGEGLPE